MKPTETKATGRPSLLRHLHAPLRHLRSNIVAYLALAVAVGSGGSYALAATSSNGTVAVCVDNGSGVMHLAKHPRCGRHQSRIGLSSALDRPTVSAWAAVEPNGAIDERFGRSPSRTRVLASTTSPLPPRAAAHAVNNAPVVSVNDSQPPAGFGGNPALFPWPGRRARASLGRDIHDPHRRGGKRGVPAKGRDVQLHRLVRIRRAPERSRRCAGIMTMSRNRCHGLDPRCGMRLRGAPTAEAARPIR